MRAGASEFLQAIEEEQLLKAADSALAQAESQWTARSAMRRLRSNYECLTRREREVLPYVVSGFLNKQTAYEFGTSEITIRIHRGRIMHKMQADSFAELVRMAVRIGVLSA